MPSPEEIRLFSSTWYWTTSVRTNFKSPGFTAGDCFNEVEFHGFWSRSFSGLGVDDNSAVTVIIREPTASGSPEGIDVYEIGGETKYSSSRMENSIMTSSRLLGC